MATEEEPEQTAAAATEGPAAPTCVLILPLGSSNSAGGTVDADGHTRASQVYKLYEEQIAAGRKCQVLVSGGSSPEDFPFNPTDKPHWRYVANLLFAIGVEHSSIIMPGLEALHTVDEAIMARKFVLRRMQSQDEAAPRVAELIVVTSDYHSARARHLFGVAFGEHAQCKVPVRVVEHPGHIVGPALAAREEHEAKQLHTLRVDPYGAWAAFLKENRLEAANKSKRWSRRMTPADREDPTPTQNGAAAASNKANR